VILRYLLALVSLIALLEAVVLWRNKQRGKRFECGDPRCVQRDKNYLQLVAEIGNLKRRNSFLLSRAQHWKATAEFHACKRLVDESEAYLRRPW
jgi:hypothetical protein